MRMVDLIRKKRDGGVLSDDAIRFLISVYTAGDIPAMAGAFRQAIEAGRAAYRAGLGRVLARGGSASDPLTGFLR